MTREVKAHLYASMSIREYWILNVLARQLEVFTEPVADEHAPFGFRYGRHAIWNEQESVQAFSALDVPVAVSEMLPAPE